MRRIAIVGAGQTGLHLGIGLLGLGYEVTIQTDRGGEEVRTGRVMSTQGMSHPSLELERAVGLDLWDETAPHQMYVEFNRASSEGGRLVHWQVPRARHGNSVCQRLKLPRWAEIFEENGGRLIIAAADIAAIEALAKVNELVFIATGKGEISEIFERDDARSPYDKPPRVLALTYFDISGAQAPGSTNGEFGVSQNYIPGIGEYFAMPGLGTTGNCLMGILEAVPNGPMDCWDAVTSPEQHLERFKSQLARFLPWEHDRVRDANLTDDLGFATGRFVPIVRKPVATLPSGAVVTGLGDVMMLNDPLTGQGSNHAAKAAAHYLKHIEERADKPFDRGWMQETFDAFLSATAEATAKWSNDMLNQTPLMMDLLAAGQVNPTIAKKIVDSFAHPPDFFPWFYEEAEATKLFGDWRQRL
ncbi:MAG: styrene monooxygenase/indole monooxygenase family protein [Pseudomonadota bacterium]|nr:styrene monooxygenase/indole monooxygenase family protein [Pseudomonadota bacterium]